MRSGLLASLPAAAFAAAAGVDRHAHGAGGNEVQVAVALAPRDQRLACIEVAPRALPADRVEALDGQALEQVDAAQRQAGRLHGS